MGDAVGLDGARERVKQGRAGRGGVVGEGRKWENRGRKRET